MYVSRRRCILTTAAVNPSAYNIVATAPNPNGQVRELIVLMRKAVQYKIITLNTNQEAIAIQVFLNNGHHMQHISTARQRK